MKVAEHIRQSLEDSIRNFELLPGDPIDEQHLMTTYEVSRTPVREALLQLQAQGMLKSLPRGGMVVAKMTISQLLSMWELLAELEGFCARLACERMTDAERETLERTHQQAATAVKKQMVKEWQAHNRAFHEVLYQGARNLYVRHEILTMRSRTGAYRQHAFSAFGLLQSSWDQHAEILRAVQARDPQAAYEAMVRHISPGQGTTNFASFAASLPRELLDD